MDLGIAGRGAIVCASSKGLGRACAMELARAGCRVVVNYTKSRDEADATADACRAHGVDVLLHQADVSQDDACKAMVAAAVEKWGRVDVLVNNAGKTKPARIGHLEDLNAADFLDVYAVNLVGAYQMIRAVAPHMKSQGAGAVVNWGDGNTTSGTVSQSGSQFTITGSHTFGVDSIDNTGSVYEVEVTVTGGSHTLSTTVPVEVTNDKLHGSIVPRLGTCPAIRKLPPESRFSGDCLGRRLPLG